VGLAAAAAAAVGQDCGFDGSGRCECGVVEYASCATPESDGAQSGEITCLARSCEGFVCLCPGDPRAVGECEALSQTIYSFDSDVGASSSGICSARTVVVPSLVFDAPSREPILREVYRMEDGRFTDAARTGAPGDGRIFITRQSGQIVLLSAEYEVLNNVFLQLSVNSGGEGGLLGIAFHPNFAQNGFFFVNYTPNDQPFRTVVSRFTISLSDPNQADASSELRIIETLQPYSNHNGGQIRFQRSTGYLLISLGDGGSGNDPQCNAQDVTNTLGAILRIDVDVPQPPLNYGIPPSNPFVVAPPTPDARAELWAWGLRNPWRFSEDSAGNIWIADVGQGRFEEIDVMPASQSNGGTNYGWVAFEGSFCNGFAVNNCAGQGVSIPACDAPGNPYVAPVYEYSHSDGCSVSGGAVYERDDFVTALRGKYIFADFCTSVLWMLELNESSGEFTRVDVPLAEGSSAIESRVVFVSASEDAAGFANASFFVGALNNLYVLEAA